MILLQSIGFCLLGLFLLYYCGNKLVDGAVVLAKKFNVSDLFIGVAIIGFGTSLPEMLSTASAARLGKPDMALGNIVGSNIANVGLVLGLGLLLVNRFKPAKYQMQEYIFMVLAMFLFTIVMLVIEKINIYTGLMLNGFLLVYMYYSLKSGRANHAEADANEHAKEDPLWKAFAFVLLGLVGLFFGADFMIKGAVSIAQMLGISERVIGLTLVAIGTSLPEVAATLAAARHGKISLTIGNVAGSNVFNVLGAAGIGGWFAVMPLTEAMKIDLLVMLSMGFVMAYLFISPKPYTRGLGAALVVLYAAYMGYLAFGPAL